MTNHKADAQSENPADSPLQDAFSPTDKQVPKISVVVPCYNIAAYVPACLESLAAQTYNNYEVVCVDDGSTDGTGAILDSFAETHSNFRVLHQEHKGTANARYTGMQALQTPYVSFVDGDDRISPLFLETLAFLIEESNADIASCGFRRMTADNYRQSMWNSSRSQTSKFFETINPQDALKLSARNDIFISLWGKLYKREIVEQHLSPLKMAYEDLQIFGSLISAASSITWTSEPLYCYISRPDSTTHTKPAPISRFWDLRKATLAYEQQYAACLGLAYATDDPNYCLRLLHHLCSQHAILQNAACDNNERRILSELLHDELEASYRLALRNGVPITNTQMLRTTLLLYAPRIHDILLGVYQRVTNG